MNTSLDDADLVILSELQKNASQSLDILSSICNLSIPTIQRRLKKLRNGKVIQREVALLNPSAVGYDMTFIILVELEHESLENLNAFISKVNSEPQVQQSYHTTGDSDFTLICLAKDMSDYEALTHRMFFGDESVRQFRTSVVMNRTKVSLEIPFQSSE